MAWNTRATYATTDPPVVLADTLQAIADDLRTNGGDRDYAGYGANNLGYFRLTAIALPGSPSTGMIVTDIADGITKQWTGSAWRTFASGYTPVFIFGSGAPSGGTGNNGDLYIDSGSGVWYVYGPKSGGAWGSTIGSIKGATGATGATGAAGTNGTNASAANWRGAYAGGTTYAQGDGVTDSGIAYVSLQAANTGNTPASSPTWWQNVSGGASVVGSTRCFLYTNSAQTITDATWTSLLFDLEAEDVGGMHSAVTNTDRITIPAGADGWYILRSTVTLQTNGVGQRYLAIYKNGGATSDLQLGFHEVVALPSGIYISTTLTLQPVYLSAGDYVKAMVYQDGGVSQNTLGSQANTNFAAVRIG